MHVALEVGQPMSLAKVDPFVDGTAVGRAGSLPFHIASQFVDSVLVVPEGAVCTEMLELYQSDGVIAEPAGALASTAAHVYLTDPADRKALLGRSDGAIVCVVSGGNNDLTRYAEVMERSLRKVKARRRISRSGHRAPKGVGEVAADLVADATAAVSQQPEGKFDVDPYEDSVTDVVPGQVVRTKEHSSTPMSVDDALSEMELVGHDFYLFVNEETGRPSVVYRRHAFDYGLISLAE